MTNYNGYDREDLIEVIEQLKGQIALLSKSRENLYEDYKSSVRNLLADLTLEDFFAAMAMQGDWAAQFSEETIIHLGIKDEALLDNAKLYYRMGRAMMQARKEHD